MKQSFKDYFEALIGAEESEQFFCSLKGKATRRGIRANTLKTPVEELEKWLSSQGYEVGQSPFSREGLELKGRGEILSLKLPYHAGFTYPQDPSSMFAVELLDPQPYETVIDLTAAPGGKSTHIAQRMQNTGVLVCNDMDTRRLKALHYNLERLGIWNTMVTRMTPHKLSLLYTETFDRVLLDPSCSGEGLLVTHDGKPDFWSTKALKRYATDQYGLLCSAFRLLKPGGRLVYSTCTLNAVEDDGVVEKLLKKFPEAQLEDIRPAGTPEQIGGLKGIRFWPHKTQTKGFFCIAITKTESTHEPEDEGRGTLSWVNKKRLKSYETFVEKKFGTALPEGKWTQRDDHLFLVSEALARFPLPARYSLSFPFFKSKQLQVTHAAALWLGQHASKGTHRLSKEQVSELFEHRAISTDSEEEGEWLALCCDFPLGTLKISKGQMELQLPQAF